MLGLWKSLNLPGSWEYIPVEGRLSAARSYSVSCRFSPDLLCWLLLQRRHKDIGLWESLV